MKKVLLLLANGFEILEASAFIDVMGWNLKEGDQSTALHTCALNKEIKSAFQHKNGTTYSSYQNELESYGVNILDQPIVVDQHIITSCGPSTATEVAFVLLEKVTDQENTKKIRGLMGF